MPISDVQKKVIIFLWLGGVGGGGGAGVVGLSIWCQGGLPVLLVEARRGEAQVLLKRSGSLRASRGPSALRLLSGAV